LEKEYKIEPKIKVMSKAMKELQENIIDKGKENSHREREIILKK